MKKVISGNVLKYLVLLLFVNYCINISFFTHAHVVNGVTIVHSHFHKDAEGEINHPKHNHKSSEIQLISHLSYFVNTGEITTSFIVNNTPRRAQCPLIREIALLPAQFEGNNYLRAPPQLHA